MVAFLSVPGNIHHTTSASGCTCRSNGAKSSGDSTDNRVSHGTLPVYLFVISFGWTFIDQESIPQTVYNPIRMIWKLISSKYRSDHAIGSQLCTSRQPGCRDVCKIKTSLQWRHHDRDGVSNNLPSIAYSTVYSGTDERSHQSSASLAFVWGIHRWLMNSPHKGQVTPKMFPFDDVIMVWIMIVDINTTGIFKK